MVLAISVGAALVLGGVVTWMALRADDDAPSTAAASNPEP